MGMQTSRVFDLSDSRTLGAQNTGENPPLSGKVLLFAAHGSAGFFCYLLFVIICYLYKKFPLFFIQGEFWV